MAELALWEREYARHMRSVEKWPVRDIAAALCCSVRTVELLFAAMPTMNDGNIAAAIAATLGELT